MGQAELLQGIFAQGPSVFDEGAYFGQVRSLGADRSLREELCASLADDAQQQRLSRRCAGVVWRLTLYRLLFSRPLRPRTRRGFVFVCFEAVALQVVWVSRLCQSFLKAF